jgi:hypothetical protein
MLVLVLFILASCALIMYLEKTWAVIFFVALLFGLPVYAGFRNTVFSFRALDKRLLRFDREGIQVGDEFFRIHDLSAVILHVDSFYGFRSAARSTLIPGSRETLYGDQNQISFRFYRKHHQYRFLLGNGRAYLALYVLMASWRKRGVKIVLTETFPYDVVLAEIRKAEEEIT